MLTLKAVLPESEISNAKNLSGKKELVSAWSVLGLFNGKIDEVITCRCWMGRSRNASTVYASIWVRGHNAWYSGRGSASGYGYHKESAAIDEAITSAGIKLFGTPYSGQVVDFEKPANIHGVGDSAIREAFLAIAEALGAQDCIICTH